MDHERILVTFRARAEIGAQLAQPARHLLEALLVGDIITEQTGVRAAVVQTRDTAEPFLTGRIPDLETHDRVGCTVEDAFGDEGCADGGRGRGGVEGVFDIALDERGLADAY